MNTVSSERKVHSWTTTSYRQFNWIPNPDARQAWRGHTFPHIIYIIYITYRMLNSCWKWPPATLRHFCLNLLLNFLEHFSYISSLYVFSQWKSSVLNSTAYSWKKNFNLRFSLPHSSYYTEEIKLNCLPKVIQCNRNNDDSNGSVRVTQPKLDMPYIIVKFQTRS
jgi:hypothetical protein